MIALDKKAYVFGGYSNRGSHNQTAEYDLISRQWSAGPSLPAARSESTAVVVGQVVVIFGGWNDKEVLANTWVAKVSAITEGKPNWEPLSAADDAGIHEPPARRMHSMVAYTTADGAACAYLFGGFADTRLNDLWKFDGATMKWTQVLASGFLPSPRDGSVLAADVENGQLIVFGGYTSCRVNEVFTFDIESASWARQPTMMPPSARFGTFGAVSNGQLVVGLGQDARGACASIFNLRIADWKWTVTPLEGDELEPRIHFSWCLAEGGKRVIIAGGSTDKRQSTSVMEIDLDKIEPAAGSPGGPKKK
jgi:hypothetical protein